MDNGFACLVLGLYVLYHVTVICDALGPKCYKCDHVVDPKDCDHYEQCSDGEKCYVQRYLGQQLNEFYRMGCMPNNVCAQQAFSLFGVVGKKRSTAHVHAIEEKKSISKREDDLLMCLQCCDGEYCNLHGQLCGTQTTGNNLRCFECTDVTDPTHCENIVECQSGYYCQLHVYWNFNANAIRYDMGCQKGFVCDFLAQTLQNQSDHVSCAQCCHDRHYCNFDLCKGSRPSLNSITTQPTPAFDVSIPGNYLDQPPNTKVTIQCNTLTGASMVWKFNGSKMLPSGVRVDQGTNNLIIDDLTQNKTGSYTCIGALSSTEIKSATTVVSISNQGR